MVVRLVKTSTAAMASQSISVYVADFLQVRPLTVEGSLWDNFTSCLDVSFGFAPEEFSAGFVPGLSIEPDGDGYLDAIVIQQSNGWGKRVIETDWRRKLFERWEGAWNQSKQMYQIYVWLVQLHMGWKEPSEQVRNEVLYRWFLYGIDGRLEKVLKYKTAWILAVALDQEELPEPIPLWPGDRVDYLLGGSMGHGLLRRLKQNSGRMGLVRLAQDLYFAKRGSLPVGDRFIEEALLKHHKLLTEHPEWDEPDWMETEVRRTVREIYCRDRTERVDVDTEVHVRERYREGRQLEEDEVLCNCYEPFYYGNDEYVVEDCNFTPPSLENRCGWGKVPTFGSCVENPRGKGGAFGWLVGNDGPGMGPPEGYFIGYAHFLTYVAEIRVPSIDWEDRFGEICRAGRCTDVIDCMPVALCEPFKVRVITRGSAEAYHLCRSYQPRIHHGMAGSDPFRLTMGPLDDRHLQLMLDKVRLVNHSHGGFWVSGDYEAATDNLHPHLSEVCMDEICQVLNVPFEDRSVLVKALTGHSIAWMGRDLNRDEKLQNWGQLMGSPVSFPVLCIINAALTRSWMEKELDQKIALRSAPMLVNGDDILFWCPGRDSYERWKEMTALAGFKASIGKNYCSDSYLVINSEISRIKRNVDYFGSETWELVQKLPSLNFGLLFGTVKSGSSHALEKTLYGTHEAQRDSLNMRAHDWVEGYPEDRDLMMCVFLKYWKALLHSVPKEMSWWVHPRFGGLGLPVTRTVTITERQRKLAAYLWVEGDTLGGIARPVPEFSAECLKGWSAILRNLVPNGTVKPYRGGRFKLNPFQLLRYYIECGFDQTDPEGNAAYLRSFMKYWDDSRKHWASPLSFRHCVSGPLSEMGVDSRIRLSYA
jgi:hypothetical protein